MMRLSKREVTDPQIIREILEECKVCRIAMIGNAAPYIVPMNYGYYWDEQGLRLYLHCASEGRKLELMRKHSQVGFEMDCGHTLIEGKQACDYSFSYASVIGSGTVSIRESVEGKREGLQRIMEHLTGKTEFLLDEKIVERTTVLELRCEEITCKRHL
ncbi:MAG: pyridoxamine 5'-phosphate oxidase family protein [Lachnospiraceae bacterium]